MPKKTDDEILKVSPHSTHSPPPALTLANRIVILTHTNPSLIFPCFDIHIQLCRSIANKNRDKMSSYNNMNGFFLQVVLHTSLLLSLISRFSLPDTPQALAANVLTMELLGEKQKEVMEWMEV
jgi:hypothetical protein